MQRRALALVSRLLTGAHRAGPRSRTEAQGSDARSHASSEHRPPPRGIHFRGLWLGIADLVQFGTVERQSWRG